MSTQGDLSSIGAGGPSFFPSISSVKTNYSILQYVRLLNAIGAERYLVSAYDLGRISASEKDTVLGDLREAKARGCAVLLDSGNYESYWKADKTWCRREFHAVAREAECSSVFSFDNQEPADTVDAIVDDVVDGLLKDTEALAGMLVCPIIHGATLLLPEACEAVAQQLKPQTIAVPERELGAGVYERVITVWRIRTALSSIAPRPRLHLLGTGNPLSLLLFAAAGADSFDGLEWCQTCADHATGGLYHFQQYDFFAYQANLDALSETSFASSVLAHNLIFFVEWMAQIADGLAQGRIRDVLAQRLPVGVLKDFEARAPKAFSWR